MPRELIYEDAEKRIYRVTDDQGNVIGEDTEMVLTPELQNEVDLRAKLAAALGSNVAFLGLESPTAAEIGEQVAGLTRQVDAMIRLQLNRLDDVAGT